jgi:F-type H+-transporting ATPase subunit b
MASISTSAYAQPEASEAQAQPEDVTQHFNYFDIHYHGRDAWGGELGDGKMVNRETHEMTDEEEPMSAPFILMLINFGIFMAILGKYLWPAGKKVAADRHDQIKSALDEAAALRAQAANKLAEYETRIKDVDAEIAQLVAGIRADAEADKQRILAAASAQAAQMKRDAELRIAAEVELARAQLTREVTSAASAATEKLLREQTSVDDQRKLVGNFLEGMR